MLFIDFDAFSFSKDKLDANISLFKDFYLIVN